MGQKPITDKDAPGPSYDRYDVEKWPLAGEYSRMIRLALAAGRYDAAYGMVGDAAAELEHIAQGDRMLSQSTPWVQMIRHGKFAPTDTRVITDLETYLDVTILGDILDVRPPVQKNDTSQTMERRETLLSYLGPAHMMRLLHMVISALPMQRTEDD